ncbi:hypothetical protein UlMin_045475 [Ulmus minor]
MYKGKNNFSLAQRLLFDTMSGCWSFGSINHPSSQSRKISVGILVDSLPKRTSVASKKGANAGLNAEGVKSDIGNSIRGKNKVDEVTVTKTTKLKEATEPANSPWITTRSFHQKASNSEAPSAQQTSNLPAGARQCKHDGAKDAALTSSVQPFANKTSVSQSDDGSQGKINVITYERKGRKDTTSDRIQDFAFANMRGDTVNTAEKGRTESLRLKLQEILGTVSSPNAHISQPPAPELGATSLNKEQEFDQVDDPVVKPRHSSDKSVQKFNQPHVSIVKPRLNSDTIVKPRQNSDTIVKPRQKSDTIETDSESPDCKVRRTVTGPLTRQRALTKAQNKSKTRGRPSYNLKNPENHAFCFGEGLPERPNVNVSHNASMSTQKKSEKKNSGNEQHKIFLPKRNKADKSQQATHRAETTLPAQETTSLGKKMGDLQSFLSKREREHLELEKDIPKRNSPESPLSNERDHPQGHFDSPETVEHQEDMETPSLRPLEKISTQTLNNLVNPQDDIQSPTFGFKTPVSVSSPSSTPETDKTEHDVSSPTLAERKFNVGKIRGFETLQTSKLDWHNNSQTELFDDVEEFNETPTRKHAPSMEEQDEEACLSESSSEERQAESSEVGSPTIDGFNRCREGDTLFPETRTAEKLNFKLRPTKRLRNNGSTVAMNDISPRSPSFKGTGESCRTAKASENKEVDGLTRAVELLAMELEKLKCKINSATSKKSSEVMISVAEDIHMRLKNAEAQIQADMGKMTNLSKLKRKRLETRFEEQEEQLKLIHEKFKEQINEHLQDCKSTFEGLEAEQLDLKGAAEKRKTSHKRLLLQVEGAIESQLNDAERKITGIHELAREKMAQLKQIVSLCLKEGVLS